MISKHNKKFFEAPWLRNQIDNHIFFGLLIQGGTWSWVILSVIAISLFFLTQGLPFNIQNTSAYIAKAFYFIALFLLFIKFPSYPRLVILWASVKIALMFFCFIALIMGGVVGLFSGDEHAILILLLSICWMPCLELFEKFATRQRMIFMLKVVISIFIILITACINSVNII